MSLKLMFSVHANTASRQKIYQSSVEEECESFGRALYMSKLFPKKYKLEWRRQRWPAVVVQFKIIRLV